ncbi:hypothetical protein DNTS_009391 [Danionella cerebrum]|uniref:LIM domain 7a n=1 Tax=Danionella cerebrum TaxID=2873325 RepID=A0A553PX90_9TELE|nr:hypothetical protein DNTS_009391 [Danionella translucida]
MLLCWDAVVTRSLTEQLSFPWTSYLPTYWLLVLPVFVLVLQAVTKKTFGSRNFRSSLENGLLLCDLINKNKPGCIKKLNRFSSPIAGLDNLNLFLKTCGKLGLKEAQLFHPGDLQDLSTRVTVKHQESSRRLKNVLITIYWLGRKAHTDPFYNGPHLNLKAFEGLLGTTLYKALEDSRGSLWGSVLKGSSRESWDSEKEQLFPLQAGHRRQDSLDSLDSLGSRKHSTSSDTTLKENSDGCGSDPEADLSFTMSENKEYRRSLVVTPKTSTQFNQFLPSKDRQSGYVPAPLRKKRTERNEDNRRSWASPMFTEDDGTFTSHESAGSEPSSDTRLKPQTPIHQSLPCEFESSDSDADRPDPDVVLDDLACRRFHSPSPVAPTNFALPMSPVEGATRLRAPISSVPQQTLTHLSSQSEPLQRKPVSAELYILEDSEEEDDEFGFADPVQDDLYARKVALTPQPSVTAPFDQFLPKFWTPEEDAHVKKIKLGSQRRPWYRKIQGFSRRKSGSSSEDSDGDVNPVHSVLLFSRTQSEPPCSRPSAHEELTQSSLTSSLSSQSLPLTAAQQSALQPKFVPPDFWPSPDPASGPRLFKCEKHPLLGREHPNDPYNVSSDIVPDLENDDMFARRTNAFHTIEELAKLKYGNFLVPRRRSLADVSVVVQPRHEGVHVYPDVEKDDVVFRKAQQQFRRCPLSGGPDNYHPVPIPESWALPPKLQVKLLRDSNEPRQSRPKSEMKHLKTDDMLLRKLRTLNTQGLEDKRPAGVSLSCSEEDIQKWQGIREASRVRYRKRLVLERSKSVSDIIEGEMNVTNSSMELRFEELQKMRTRLKENEEKWQDDLTKWKNKRRSVNSDIVKKKEDREQVEQISSGNTRKSKTFKEMQEERESRGQSSLRDSLSSIVDDVFEPPVPVPRTRTLPPRSYTVDTPYSHSIKPSMIEKEPITGTLATDEADSPTKPDRLSPEFPANNSIHESPTLTQSPLDDPVPALSNSTCSVLKPTSILKPNFVESTSETKQTESSSGPISSLYKPNSMDTKSSSLDQVSASLPKSYQRSDQITRLPSVVTPRPFGPQSNRIASLPRAFTVEDSVQRTNGEAESKENKKTPVPNRYAQNVTDDDRSLESSALNREAEKPPSPVPPVSRVSPLPKSSSHSSEMGFSEMRISLNQKPNSSQDFGFQHSWDSTGVWVKSVLPGSPAELCQMQAADEILAVNGHRVADMSYSEWKSSMEEALQQGSLLIDIRRHGKNNSGRDLPSLPYKSHKTINLTSLDPLGSSEPFLRSSLDFTSQQTKETVLKTVNVSSQPLNNYGSNGINGGIREDSVSMESKESVSVKNLKRRSEFFEQGNRTASGQCWCVMFGGTWVNKSSSFSPSSQALHKCALPLGSAGLTVSSLLYLCGKEEMTVFTGGSDASITAVAVPPITPSNTRWSWDPEEERRRQEKWQKEQERLLQGLDKHNLFSPLSSVQLPPASWEEQEKRKREGEILRLEEERRKQKEIDLFEEKRKREEEERKRREEERRLLEEEMKKREERERLEEQRRKKEEEERLLQEKERNRKEEEERKRLAEQKRWQQQDAGDSFGYTNVYPELSYSHRSISKSTPELDEVSKTDIKGVYSRHRGLAGWLLEDELRRKRNTESQKKQAASELELERRSILNAMKYRNPERASSGLGDVSKDYKKESQAALDRQQILQEMKKKTSLNTDNSWIRQQSTAGLTAKEPIDLPMRRGESLDNLDIPRSSWRSSWSTSSSTSTIPDYSRPHSALSGSSSYYSGRPGSVSLLASQSMSSLKQPTAPSLNAPEPQPRAPPRNSVLTARLIWEAQKLEQKSEYETRSSIVTPAMCDSKLGSPQPCDLTVLQQIEEEPITDKNL